MKKKVSYGIAEPCHEDWNAMIPEEKGRFCKSCEKTVIDFTRMSLPEIHRFMEHAKTSVLLKLESPGVKAKSGSESGNGSHKTGKVAKKKAKK